MNNKTCYLMKKNNKIKFGATMLVLTKFLRPTDILAVRHLSFMTKAIGHPNKSQVPGIMQILIEQIIYKQPTTAVC